jgi:NAD(P)-dependent dehydrogenase (short-subunit alcohol dehydrogenase family)
MATKKRIALVPGGNLGLGFETCHQLAQLGLTVILTARDTTKGKVASKRLSDKELDVTSISLMHQTKATLIV